MPCHPMAHLLPAEVPVSVGTQQAADGISTGTIMSAAPSNWETHAVPPVTGMGQAS
jgi:hypothetical protein